MTSVLVVFLLLTGWGRLFFGRHHLTDIIGGYALGIAWTVSALLATDWYFLRRSSAHK